MRVFFLTVGLLLVGMTHAQAEGLFRWVDKAGKVHYGDKPAEDAIGAEQKKFGAHSASGDDELSYGVRKAKQDFPVTVFVAANCGDLCVQARALLNKRGVPFAEKTLSTKEDLDAYKKLTGGTSVPALSVGKTVLNGFEAGQWHSELDIAGYPKTAPFGSRPAQTPVAKPDASKASEQ